LKRLTYSTHETNRQVSRLRKTYDRKVAQWDARTAQLEKTRDELKQRVRALKQRQLFDLEGFENDVSTLEGEMKFVQNAMENGPGARARANQPSDGRHANMNRTPLVKVPGVTNTKTQRARASVSGAKKAAKPNCGKSAGARKTTSRDELDRRIADLLENAAVLVHSE
jgi:hypothetical protein